MAHQRAGGIDQATGNGQAAKRCRSLWRLLRRNPSAVKVVPAFAARGCRESLQLPQA